ncbi:TPA: stress-induced protein, partial [Streptococcus pyogenes]|nr:stress-induced protein [Streptococcus pyogenes]
VGGNLRAVELIASISTNNKDSLDKKEQRERIKALELENDRRRNVLSNVDKTENALAEYFEKLDEVVNNDT